MFTPKIHIWCELSLNNQYMVISSDTRAIFLHIYYFSYKNKYRGHFWERVVALHQIVDHTKTLFDANLKKIAVGVFLHFIDFFY